MSGTIKTYYSLKRLVRRIESQVSQFDLISIDLFDTLMIRRVHNPDLLKLATARYIARRSESAGEPWTAEQVMELRNKIELAQRLKTAENHQDHEARYPDFMREVLKTIFKTEDETLLNDVTQYELSIETQMLVPRSGFVRLLMKLKSLKKRIIVISDIYLPSTHLRILIDQAGLGDLIDEVFSSADHFEAKASGVIWSRIAKQIGVEYKSWIHIGDNPISDGIRPAELGINAYVLRDIGEAHRKKVASLYFDFAKNRPYWRGRLVQQWMLPLEDENTQRNPLYTMGYHFFAPFLCSFVQHVAEQCRSRKIDHVYFFSREGQILKDLWDLIIPIWGDGSSWPQSHYLHVSRMALAETSCAHKGLDYEKAKITFLPKSNRDFTDVCRVFNLNLQPFLPLLARYSLKADTALSKWHSDWNRANGEQFNDFLKDVQVQNEIRKQTLSSNKALEYYLESERFFGSTKVGLVDIGWHGTIQHFLHQSIQHLTNRPELNGFLLVSTGEFPFRKSSDNLLEGFFHDREHFDFCGSLALYEQDLFEETTRAPHTGLLSYEPDPKGFRLAFRSDNDACAQSERLQSEYFSPLQKGILDAARRYAVAMSILGYTARDWKSWLNVLAVNQLAFPKIREMQLLKHTYHLDDFARSGPSGARAKRSRKLWSRTPWQMRLLPGLRTWYYLMHAIHQLRQ